MTDVLPILPRELTDLPEEVRMVPPPPTPQLREPFSIRLVEPEADTEMIAEWMNRPHLAETWEYDRPVTWWRGYLRAQLAGEYSRPFVGIFKGNPQGYVEVYRAAKDSIAPCYEADPYDLGLHAAIADLDIVNRGFGPLLLPRLAASLFQSEPRCKRIMFDPDHRNTAARRLCEYARCDFLGEHQMSNRRMALYALNRPADGQ
ncbi:MULTISPECIES: GNAT family N-acetyltransferase [Mycolicibacterium]|jgi:RimJ/RimL family protein N-acetyltransferase|uniref:Lysine N-acyltransferase MbtK n=1 Tax=Mycolicibacterium poriferae TaxID=39694 RepID=A0A6N4VC38_9MYCO|nr:MULTISPECIES: GNAT family N-acetyltransferase [Mycolicibacterium]MCG7579797.1 acetyltransferase [Mycolicibacterium sp. OfavD-34-C]MCV7261619.1 acetyltransferase [Mycolicibacterium poriferae]BBX51237.1 siderophore biosynthesis protein [Mycolicibacterium poriferae]